MNRLLCPMLNEAVFAVRGGIASAQEIDDGMKLGCNHPIGPLALADLIGLDVLLAVMDVFYRDFNDPSTGRRRCSRRWSPRAISVARRGVVSTRTVDLAAEGRAHEDSAPLCCSRPLVRSFRRSASLPW